MRNMTNYVIRIGKISLVFIFKYIDGEFHDE